MKKVVFLNRIKGEVDKNSSDIGFSGLWDIYEFDEIYNEDTLFAYEVSWHHTSSRDETMNLLKKEGIFFLKTDSESRIYIAATREQLEKIFLTNKKYNGYYLGADAIERLDMSKLLLSARESGVIKSVSNDVEWFNENFDKLVPFLGTDKNRVTLTVPIIAPDEMK
ncbi:MAG: hypothetical protein J6B96_04030 [Agathobacter sp.]|nr:hypothetical protein [Agathobacter sp.]